MKSGKQRRLEIRMQRRQKAEKLAASIKKTDFQLKFNLLVVGQVEANHAELVHNNTYGDLPLFYIDKAFDCRDCGSPELWTAKQQKWWYEIAKGNINAMAVRCRSCRKKEQLRKAEARKIHLDGIAKKLNADSTKPNKDIT